MIDVRPVPGYEGVYTVDETGAIRRIAGGSGATAGRVLRQTPCDKRERPYLTVTLHNGGTKQRKYVHHIVAEVFVGPRPAGYDVNHKDLDKRNNAASNLEYKTRAQNVQHSFDNDADRKTARGDTHPCAKLRTDDVLKIRAASGMDERNLATVYGVSVATIFDVIARRTWRHI